MSDQDAISAVALVVALVALVTSVAQLLQAIFGTAEGFRRTNRQIIGPFSQTRDRVFHITELRYETKFRTPHFKFKKVTSTQLENNSSTSKEARTSQDGTSPRRTRFGNSSRKEVKKKPFLYIEAYSNEEKVLQDFITSPAVGRISKLQRVLHWIDSCFNKPRYHHLIEEHSKAYAAGWLSLLDQLFERERRVHHTTEGSKYRHKRLISTPNVAQAVPIKSGPDPEQWHRPAIELEERSWDLMPPDVVRPLASIDLGDMLTLCFRLRIEIHPEERSLSADGFGHSFSPLRVQGLGTVVQYRFDPSLSYADDDIPANPYFAPSEACDKLAFGIIPANPRLGINRDWKVNTAPNFVNSIMTHFEELGVSEEARRLVRDDKSQDKQNTYEALCESLLLLCPPLIVDGLGIIKYVPPFTWKWTECTLRYRESYIVLRTSLNQMYPGLVDKERRLNQMYPGPTEREKTNLRMRESQNPPTRQGNFRSEWRDQREWVGAVLNFFERTQHDRFVSVRSMNGTFSHNAKGTTCEEVLRQFRTALAEADQYLQDYFEGVEIGAYEALVAAHMEMALTHHAEVKQEDRKSERERCTFRDGTGIPGVWPRKTETVHRYVDSATTLEGAGQDVTIVGLYRKQYNTKFGVFSSLFSEDIQQAWFTMMLRAFLWGFIHLPIHLPWLPYKSRYYGDSTLVMIA